MAAGTLPRLLIDVFSIVLIDLLLAGDNALVIALAVRMMAPEQRRRAIRLGAAASVVLRVVLTILAARLLGVDYLNLMGGIFVIWIAVRVLSDASAPPPVPEARGRLLDAVWLIVVADITMSTDNVLAVAGAARGSVPLIVFGLCVSIPFVIFSSDLIARLMERYPAVLYFGAAILGRVGAEMIFTDGLVVRTFHPSETVIYVAEAVSILGVLAVGRFLSVRAREKSRVPVEALHGR